MVSELLDVRYLVCLVCFPQPIEPRIAGLGIRRRARDNWHKLGDGFVNRGADRSRRAINILKRGRDSFDKRDSSFRSNDRVFPSDLLDLAQRFLKSLDCGLRLPAEGVAPEARLELPFVLARDPNGAWLVYEADLSLEIPQVAEKDSNHTVELDRSFNGPIEDALIKKAEAVYQGPNKMIDTILRDPRWLAEHIPEDSEPLWWIAGNDNVRLTTIVTARAVHHYYDLSLKLRQNPDAVPGFRMNHTSLAYRANIKRYGKYSHGEDRFSDVYLADLNLEWPHSCGGLCGMSFKRNKVVILSASGDVLAMYLDAPVNSSVTVS